MVPKGVGHRQHNVALEYPLSAVEQVGKAQISGYMQTHNQEVRQAAMAKLQKGRKSQAQRQSRAKMTRNQSKSKGRKSKVSVLDL